MKMLPAVLVVAAIILVAGCVNQSQVQSGDNYQQQLKERQPAIKIASPSNGDYILDTSATLGVSVKITVANFILEKPYAGGNPGIPSRGYIRILLDNQHERITPVGEILLTDMTEGQHTIHAELYLGDGTPTGIYDEVTFMLQKVVVT